MRSIFDDEMWKTYVKLLLSMYSRNRLKYSRADSQLRVRIAPANRPHNTLR